MPNVTEKNQPAGLSGKEAARRLKKFGANIVFQRKKFRPLVAFVRKLNSPFLLILIFASLVSFGIGERTNATILLLMVSVSAVLDFVNSYKSEKAVRELVSRVVTTATVVRDGKKVELEFKEIVPGDLVMLTAGDVIPADSEILESRDFFVNQSVLTGEAFPVEKIAETGEVGKKQSTPQKNNLVFLGTSVTTGYATARVLKTGRETEFGKIADRLVKTEPATEFEKNIRQFSLFIMQVTVVLVGLVFFINAFSGRGWLTSFIFAVAIAIGLTPELLPVIISVALSRGSIQMAKKEVIVKNLSSIQNFGSMNVLCTDKTGTITENRIVLVKYMDGFGNIDEEVLLSAYLNSYFYTGVKNPLDDAVNAYKHLDISEYKKIDEIPFDFERKKRSVVVERSGARTLIAKGAPEEVFKICDTYWQKGKISKLDAAARKKINDQFQNLSREGFRVLGVAQKEVGSAAEVYSKKEESQMIFYGFVAFFDPPKATAREAVRELKDLGVEVKILTGDNELLTEKICAEINVACMGIMVGDEIDQLTDAELQSAAIVTTIFARVTPEQKERIIINLRKAGKVVGYLGDGINDAPALKAGDIGISVANAVDVAKDTADIILLRKSLRVLRDGVIEGRKTFRNTLKYILMGLSSNFGNMFSMTAASAFLPFLPMLPTQILLNNFFYDISQLTLSADAVDRDDIKKPTVWSLGFIKKYMLIFGLVSSLFDFLTFGALLLVFRLPENQFQTGWFIESLATQVFVIYVIRTKKIPFLQSRPSKVLFLNTFLLVVLAWVIPFLAIGKFFHFAPLPFTVSAVIFGLTIVYLILVEFVKRIFYKKYNHSM
jgi:Mg2+-importing ATPase